MFFWDLYYWNLFFSSQFFSLFLPFLYNPQLYRWWYACDRSVEKHSSAFHLRVVFQSHTGSYIKILWDFYILENGTFRYLDIKIGSLLSVGVLWGFQEFLPSFLGVLQMHFPWCGWIHLFWSMMYCFFQIKTFHWLRVLLYRSMFSWI